MPKKVNIGIFIGVLGLLSLGLGLWFFYFYSVEGEYQRLSDALPVHYNGKQFAGSASCIPCHEAIYKTHLKTAHHKTSGLATDENVFGSFNSDKDRIDLVGSRVRMLKESDAFYQQRMDFGSKKTFETRIDMVIGSGVKGQSHLAFKGDSLYQLQASYFTLTDSWINSPGYPNYGFRRPVMDNCIKCHVTFAKNESFSGNTNIYEKNSFIYGIECERCHGPSQEHVDFRTGKTPTDHADPIVGIEALDRQLQMDICAQCHAGLQANQLKGNPFSYIVGENLEDYAKNYYTGKPESELDVHGNQVGLLKSSECFNNSVTMSCTTCHDPHRNQRGDQQHFNAKCIECHNRPLELHESFSRESVEISKLHTMPHARVPVPDIEGKAKQ